jgi:hypothetical protein
MMDENRGFTWPHNFLTLTRLFVSDKENLSWELVPHPCL